MVGVSVRNSRSAKNEMNANIAIVALRPSRNAAANTATIHHQARTRAMNDGGGLLVLDPGAQDASDHRGDDQQGDHAANEPIKLV